jgi:hypothetical protein
MRSKLLEAEQQVRIVVSSYIVALEYLFVYVDTWHHENQRTQFCAYVVCKDLFESSPNLPKRVVETGEVEQVMKLGFLNLAKKVMPGWIAKPGMDESH